MRHQLLSLLLAICSTLSLSAQKEERVSVLEVQPIDTAFLKASYRYVFQQKEKQASSQMELLVGDKAQLFIGADDYFVDSLGLALENKAYPTRWIQEKLDQLPFGRSNIKWRILSGHPAGKVTILDRIFVNHYISEEPLVIPKWKTHSDSTKQMMGYTCHLAEVDLHGRHWYAWYTPEVACSFGPWLLHGVPGLVVQAYDSKHIHDFLLLRVEHRKVPLGLKKLPYTKAPRERVIKEWIKYAQDPGKVMFGSGLVKTLDNKPLPKRTFFYIPLRNVKP